MENLKDLLDTIDYNQIIGLSSYITCFLLGNIGYKEYKLQKEYKPKSIKDIHLTPNKISKEKDIDYKRIVLKELKEEIIEFIGVITRSFSNEDLTFFYNNINNVNINIMDKSIQKNINGYYLVDSNTIYIVNKKNPTIYHELFHLSSSTMNNNIEYSGFFQLNDKTHSNIGLGLNEGYTQVLTERYFDYIKNLNHNYIYEVFIAKKIENIVGKDIMEKLYLNADLTGLICELEKYIKTQDIFNFITKLDFINAHRKDKFLSIHKKIMLKNAINDVTMFLIKIYINKNKDTDSFKNTFPEYLEEFNTEIELNRRIYDLFPTKRIQNYLRHRLNIPNLIIKKIKSV